MDEWKELIPFIKFSLVMLDVYLFARMFSREVVRIDVDHNKIWRKL